MYESAVAEIMLHNKSSPNLMTEQQAPIFLACVYMVDSDVSISDCGLAVVGSRFCHNSPLLHVSDSGAHTRGTIAFSFCGDGRSLRDNTPYTNFDDSKFHHILSTHIPLATVSQMD